MQTVLTRNPETESKLRQLRIMRLDVEREKRRRQGIADTPKIIQSQYQAYIQAYPLTAFIEETFPILEPGRTFYANWHIDIISELLQATVTGEVKHFLINIPRRSMKSLLACVMFPCWAWTFMPHIRFLYTSYNAKFAGRDNKKCHQLMTSEYYQQRWGGNFFFTTEQVQSEIRNSRGGFRTVFKIGKGTGEGADFVFADDPNAIDETESDLMLEKTNLGWREISYHNVANRQTAVRGGIQQRTNENDFTGYILDNPEMKEYYAHLCLPMKFELDHPHQNTKHNPLFLGKVSVHEKARNPRLTVDESKLWIDPRSTDALGFDNEWYQAWYKTHFKEKGYTTKGEGQLLWENYITEEEAKKDVAHLGVYGQAAQLQQNPIIRGGNFFNSTNFEHISLEKMPRKKMLFIRSWDKGGSQGRGDPTVGMLYARTLERPFQFFIIDVFKKQISLYERMATMKEIAKRDMMDYIDGTGENEYIVVIEKEGGASGTDLSTIERDALMEYNVMMHNPRQKIEVRAMPAKSMSEGGRIKIIKGFWNQDFIRELERFKPDKKKQRDDQVVTFIQAHRVATFYNTSRGGSSSGVI